jgi:hypothetical protein
MWQAWSQVGSRLAVASMANISRPDCPDDFTTGVDATLRRNASTSGRLDFPGSFFFAMAEDEWLSFVDNSRYILSQCREINTAWFGGSRVTGIED